MVDHVATIVTSLASRLERCQVCGVVLCPACYKKSSFPLSEGLSVQNDRIPLYVLIFCISAYICQWLCFINVCAAYMMDCYSCSPFRSMRLLHECSSVCACFKVASNYLIVCRTLCVSVSLSAYLCVFVCQIAIQSFPLSVVCCYVLLRVLV